MRKWIRVIIAAVALVVITLAVVYAVDYYRKTTQGRSIDPCVANLKMIAGAIDSWTLEHHRTTNDIPTWADLVGPSSYFTSQPTCHLGGTYTLHEAGHKPTCTVPGHSF